jgi:hypothetical protein
MLVKSVEGFDLAFREEILKGFFFSVLHFCGNVAQTEKPHPDVMDLFIGVLKAGFPADFSQIFECPCREGWGHLLTIRDSPIVYKDRVFTF